MAARLTWPSLLDAGPGLGEPLLPHRDGGIGGETLLHVGELEASLGELLGESLAPYPVLLRGKARRLHGLAGLADPPLGEHALLIERAQRRIRFLHGAARLGELRLDLESPAERLVESRLELENRGIAAGELRFQPLAMLLELRALLDHAPEAHPHRGFGRAARLDADEKIARGDLRRLSARARAGERLAAHLPLALEILAPQVEIRADRQPLLERLAGAAETFLGGGDLARVLGGLRLDALAAQRRFLGAGARRLELTRDVGMAAVRGLNAGLRRVALGLRLGEALAHGGEPRPRPDRRALPPPRRRRAGP